MLAHQTANWPSALGSFAVDLSHQPAAFMLAKKSYLLATVDKRYRRRLLNLLGRAARFLCVDDFGAASAPSSDCRYSLTRTVGYRELRQSYARTCSCERSTFNRLILLASPRGFEPPCYRRESAVRVCSR